MFFQDFRKCYHKKSPTWLCPTGLMTNKMFIGSHTNHLIHTSKSLHGITVSWPFCITIHLSKTLPSVKLQAIWNDTSFTIFQFMFKGTYLSQSLRYTESHFLFSLLLSIHFTAWWTVCMSQDGEEQEVTRARAIYITTLKETSRSTSFTEPSEKRVKTEFGIVFLVLFFFLLQVAAT